MSKARKLVVYLWLYGIISMVTAIAWQFDLTLYVQYPLHWMMFCGGLWTVWLIVWPRLFIENIDLD